MLIYAIVLILVMLVTNNPKLRSGMDFFIAKLRRGKTQAPAKEGDKA